MLLMLIVGSYAGAQVSVTATSGSVGPTVYTSLNATFSAINAGTHQGVISIQITGNTVEPAISIPLFKSGASSNYTSITITPSGGDWTIYSPSQTDNTVMVDLAGADNVTIDGDPQNTGLKHLSFVISPLNATRTAVIRLSSIGNDGADGAQNNTIKNCNIVGSRYSTTAATLTYGIYMAGAYSAISITNLTAAACHNNSFINNSIKRCLNGIVVSGTGSTFPANNLLIKGNRLGSDIPDENIGTIGISLTNTNASGGSGPAIVEGNEIEVGSGHPATSPYLGNVSLRGISIAQGNDGLMVRRNHIHDIINSELPTNAIGGQAYGIAITVSTSNVVIENNIIRDIVASRMSRASNSAQGAYGIHINGPTASGIRINHNTILLNTPPENGPAVHPFTACMNILSPATGLAELKNNILVNKIAGDSSFAIRMTASNYAASSTEYDYNNYFVMGTNLGLFGNTGVGNLAGWQAASGRDANSLNVNPVFVSATDLHLSTTSALLNGQGIAMASIQQDFDGDSRSVGVRPNGPDIGADEYVPGCTSAAGGVAAASPAGPFCGLGSTTIMATGFSMAGAGITYQWQSATEETFSTPVDIGNPSATYSNLSTGAIRSTTYFRLKVVCNFGPVSAYSNVVPMVITTEPNAQISYTGSPYCSNGNLAIVTLAGTAGGIFSATSGLDIHPSTGTVNLRNSTPGTYAVVYSIAGGSGCSAFNTSTTLTINAQPNAGTLAGAAEMRSGNTASFTTTGDAGGIWSSNNPLVATVNSSGLVMATGIGVTQILYAVTAAGCGSFYAQTKLKVVAATLTNLYPNPANNVLNVIIESEMKQFVTIVIADIMGRQVQFLSGDIRPGFTTKSINIRNLADGMYVLKLVNSLGQEIFTGRFIKAS